MSDTQLSILDTRSIFGDMGSMQEFAHLIRLEMERQGIEGQQIAESLEIGQSMVSDIVNAKKKNPPSPEIFKGIGRALGLSQVRMLQALGYLDLDSAETDARALPAQVEQILRDIDWNDDAIRDAVNVLSLVRRGQRGYTKTIDPSEYQRKSRE